MPVMSLAGRGRGRPGFAYRHCTTCSTRVVYASRLTVDGTAVEAGLVEGALLCDACVKERPWLRLLVNPLPVLTVEQRRREERESKPHAGTHRRQPKTKRCRACGGAGCHNCDGKGRVAA